MYVYKVVVGVYLINEHLRNSGGREKGGCGLFKEGYLNLLKNSTKTIMFNECVIAECKLLLRLRRAGLVPSNRGQIFSRP